MEINDTTNDYGDPLPQEDVVTDESTGTEETPVETPKVEEPPKFRVKAAGREVEVTQEELIKAYQKSVGAEERMTKAAEMEKQAVAILKLAKEDPKAFLSHPAIGADIKAFVQRAINEQLEEEMLTPEQKEQRAMRQELERLRGEAQRQKEAEESARMEQLTAHYQEELSNQIVSALDTSGLPRTEQTVARIAQYMQVALENGLENVTAADVVPYVKRDYEQAIKALLGTADETSLLNLLGDELTSKAVKAHLNKSKKAPAATPASPVVGEKKGSKAVSKKSLKEWRKEMDEKFGDIGASQEYD